MSSNGANSSCVGLRGTEDLGDGLKAGFWIESGFNPDTGTQSDSSRLFNRRTTVSLISDTFGEVRLGRDTTPTYNVVTAFDAFGTNGVGSVTSSSPSSEPTSTPTPAPTTSRATSCREAQELVDTEQGDFDLVLMDLHMSGMNGYDLTRALRARHSPQALPIVALTAAAFEEDRERCLSVGMNDFVAKPISAERLRAVLVQWASRRRGQARQLPPSARESSR